MRIIDFIVCDDIRQETSGKTTLVGIYDEKLILGIQKDKEVKWPSAMKLCFFSRYIIEKNDTHPDMMQLEIVSYNGQTVSANGPIPPLAREAAENRLLSYAIIGDGFSLQGIGEIKFNVKFLKSDKIVFEVSPVYKLMVEVAQPKA